MLVRVEYLGGVGKAAVFEADNLTRLEVQLSKITETKATTVLAESQLGYLSGGYAWLAVAALRTAAKAALPSGPNVARDFDAMIDYAAKHSWLSNDGKHVRAHCEIST